jgi:salicylate hydroxylase
MNPQGIHGANRPEHPIVIAGGGIGGLATAIALARTGWHVRILEQAPELSEAGAGIQLSPNALGLLGRWDVARRLRSRAVAPDRITLYGGLDGKVLANLPLGPAIEKRYGAPYWVVHRADLQDALLATARTFAEISIDTGFRVAAAETGDNGVTAIADDGRAVSAAALIGADGLWSTCRALVGFDAPPRFSGRTAWRTLLPVEDTPPPFSGSATGLWLAPRSHLVHYPVSGGTQINVVAIVESGQPSRDWNAAGDPHEIRHAFRDWAQVPRTVLDRAGEWRKWALHDLAALPRWCRGRLTLLGDAAHPMLPFLAQGGAMAIEDAASLAAAVANTPRDLPEAFLAYELARRSRTRRVQGQSRRMGEIYHLQGAAAGARNMVLRASPPRWLLHQNDWIYRYRPA